MKIKDLDYYEKSKEANKDFYGAGIINYAEKWADIMEEHLDKGELMTYFAEKTSQEADTEGITGFMYGAAVNFLAGCWEYGDDLRKWHNKDYGYEGEGTINPAIITIG